MFLQEAVNGQIPAELMYTRIGQ